MTPLTKLGITLLNYKDNKHLEKRIEAIEIILRECYNWTEEEIQTNKSLFSKKDERSVDKYVKWVEEFHSLYFIACCQVNLPRNKDKTEQQTLDRLLMHIKLCLKTYPVKPK